MSISRNISTSPLRSCPTVAPSLRLFVGILVSSLVRPVECNRRVPTRGVYAGAHGGLTWRPCSQSRVTLHPDPESLVRHDRYRERTRTPPSPQLPLPIPPQRFAILPTHDLHERLYVVAPVRRPPRLPVRLTMHRNCHNPTLADIQATVQSSAPSRTTACCTPLTIPRPDWPTHSCSVYQPKFDRPKSHTSPRCR